MFCNGRVEYDGRIVIIIGANISRLLWGVYIIVPASIAAIIIIVDVFIIFYRDVVLSAPASSSSEPGTSCCIPSRTYKAMGYRHTSLHTNL